MRKQLLVGGVDAVTSAEALRKEVSASLKNPECLSGRMEYVKNQGVVTIQSLCKKLRAATTPCVARV